MVTLRKLEPKEVAVLDAIIDLRLNGEDDIFEYDHKAVQESLNRTGDSKRLLITLDVQRKIVMDLSRKQIISTDWIADNRFDNMFHVRINPYCTDMPKSRSDYSWANQTNWARKKLQEKEGLSIEEAYVKYKGKLFIKMTKEDIGMINYDYMPSHKVRLAFDAKNPHLCIKIDDEDWRCISRLDSRQSPYKILKYTIAHPGKRITRKILSDKKIVKESRSLKTQVFSDNEKVKALIPLLLEIDSDSILYKGCISITLCELNGLKVALKI